MQSYLVNEAPKGALALSRSKGKRKRKKRILTAN